MGECALWLDMGTLDGEGRAVPTGLAEEGLSPDPGLVTPAAVLQSHISTRKVRETQSLEWTPILAVVCACWNCSCLVSRHNEVEEVQHVGTMFRSDSCG